MAVGLPDEPQLEPVAGIRLGAAAAGIRKPGRTDLLVMEIAPGATAAAVFTRNRFCAAPVHIARRHLAATAPRYCLVNSGNANAGTGAAGTAAALKTCRALAELAGCEAEAVLPFSTGVIGEPLPVDRITGALPQALAALTADGWDAAARAIMTTDTVPKGRTSRYVVEGQPALLTGIVKGAGMIRPDMATLLAYIATDAGVEHGLLQDCLEEAVDKSFNRISIDGDTSTNDACLLLATGAGPARVGNNAGRRALQDALDELCMWLAQAVVRDGEGATRFVTVNVEGGTTQDECLRIAYAVAESPLVKTALFAGDPNWGRILAAVGRSGPADLEVGRIALFIDDCCIVRDGGRAADYREAEAQAIMAGSEYTLRIDLGRGRAAARVWTCDLSYDYVRINAEYRT